MPRTLYVTYTREDLLEHAKSAMQAARDKGWLIDDGTVLTFQHEERLQKAAAADALLLLSALRYSNYNQPTEKAIHEREWDAAQSAGKPTRALIVDPNTSWPINQIEQKQADTLDLFHKKLKKSNPCEYFKAEPQSASTAATVLLSLIETEIKQMAGATVFVVWDTTIPGLELLLSHLHRRPPARMTIRVPALNSDPAGGHLLNDVVIKGVRESDRVLVVADRPNANVAFEVGLALGFGKMISLVHFGAEIPQWLKKSVFKGFVINPVSDLQQLNRILQTDAAWYKPRPAGSVPLVGDTLFLAPSKYVGEALREEQKQLFPEWQTIGNNGIEVDDLPQRLRDVAQVVWSIASFSEGTDMRDGVENAVNAIVAGWFLARAIDLQGGQVHRRLRVLLQAQAREVADVMGLSETFRDLEQFASIVRQTPTYDDLPAFAPVDQRNDNDVSYKMVRIPSKLFASPVWVGVNPVTNRQFIRCCELHGRQPPAGMRERDPDEPAVCVSYLDAEFFCQKLQLALPNESLWREFALAGSTGRYWWGYRENVLNKVAWYEGNSERRVQKVGLKVPNPWGLFDVLGNVWEWTEKYAETRAVDPRTLDDVKGVDVSKAKILGGAFDSPATDLTSSQSIHLHEVAASIGFRCVLFT
jgi:hypothetical protein